MLATHLESKQILPYIGSLEVKDAIQNRFLWKENMKDQFRGLHTFLGSGPTSIGTSNGMAFCHVPT